MDPDTKPSASAIVARYHQQVAAERYRELSGTEERKGEGDKFVVPDPKTNRLMTCSICYDDSLLLDGVMFNTQTYVGQTWRQVECNHWFCLKCVRAYLCTLIGGMRTRISCPDSHCKYQLMDYDVSMVLGETSCEYQRYRELMQCDYADIHRNIMRGGNPALKQWLTSHTKSCPRCFLFVERDWGCDHMRCVCNTAFCFKCGLVLPWDRLADTQQPEELCICDTEVFELEQRLEQQQWEEEAAATACAWLWRDEKELRRAAWQRNAGKRGCRGKRRGGSGRRRRVRKMGGVKGSKRWRKQRKRAVRARAEARRGEGRAAAAVARKTGTRQQRFMALCSASEVPVGQAVRSQQQLARAFARTEPQPQHLPPVVLPQDPWLAQLLRAGPRKHGMLWRLASRRREEAGAVGVQESKGGDSSVWRHLPQSLLDGTADGEGPGEEGNPLVTCPICYCDSPFFSGAMFRADQPLGQTFRQSFGCDHWFCEGCAKQHVTSQLAALNPHMRCPMAGCQYRLGDADVAMLFPPGPSDRVYSRYRELLEASYEGVYREVMASDSGDGKGQQQQPGLKAWLLANTKACPKCYVFVERTEGCNSMRCVCGTHFLYCCGQASCCCPIDGEDGELEAAAGVRLTGEQEWGVEQAAAATDASRVAQKDSVIKVHPAVVFAGDRSAAFDGSAVEPFLGPAA